MLAVMERENPTPLQTRTAASMGRTGSQTGQPHDSSLQWAALATEQEEEDLYLCEMAGTSSLAEIVKLQAVINTTTSTVSHLGAKLPQLQDLNLNGSVIESLRDLGSRFHSLTVLWVSRCMLSSLDGVSSMPALRELYCSYNDLDDVQPLAACTQLEVLDLEGNCIPDVDNLGHLATCTTLQSLTLSGNPAATLCAYIQAVTAVLPQLQYLDDVPLCQAPSVADVSAGPFSGGAGKPSGSNIQQGYSGSSNVQQGCSGRDQVEHVTELSLQCMESKSHETVAHAGSADELELIVQGIKHARVGIDSHDYQEFEGSMLAQDAQPSLTASSPYGYPSQQVQVPMSAQGWPASPPLTAASSMEAASRQLPMCTAVMPGTPGAWLRTMQSVACGALADLRASREGSIQGPPGGTPPGLESSIAGLSSCGSRPSSSSAATPRDSLSSCSNRGAAQRPGSAMHAAAPLAGQQTGLQQLRTGSAASTSRPYSARPGTAGSFRPGTSASMPSSTATTGGLYWRKHRINATGASLAALTVGCGEGEGGPREGEAEGDQGAGSSALTFGGAAIGGSLARDLRRRKASQNHKPATAPAGTSGVASKSTAACGLHCTSGQQSGSGTSSTSQPPSSTIYDGQQLLEELRRWKVETADRACHVGDGDGDGHGHDQLWDGCDSAAVSIGGFGAGAGGDQLQMFHHVPMAAAAAACHTDILDLSDCRISSPSDAMLAVEERASVHTSHILSQEQGSSTGARRTSAHRSSQEHHAAVQQVPNAVSRVPERVEEGSSDRKSSTSSTRRLASSTSGKQGKNRTVLCKVVQDAAASSSNSSSQQQQTQQPATTTLQEALRVKPQRVSATGEVTLTRTAPACASVPHSHIAPYAARSEQHAAGRLTGASAGRSHQPQQCSMEHTNASSAASMVAKNNVRCLEHKLSSREEQPAEAQDTTIRIRNDNGCLHRKSSSREQQAESGLVPISSLVASAAGEVDMTRVNPTPVRYQHDDD